MAVFQDVVSLIADQLGLEVEDVTADSRIVEDLGAESADIANIIAAAEDHLGIRVDEEKIKDIEKVSDLYSLLQSD